MIKKVGTIKYVITQKGIKKTDSIFAYYRLSEYAGDILRLLDGRRKFGLTREELGRKFRGLRSGEIANALKRLIRKGFVKRRVG